MLNGTINLFKKTLMMLIVIALVGFLLMILYTYFMRILDVAALIILGDGILMILMGILEFIVSTIASGGIMFLAIVGCYELLTYIKSSN